MAGRANGDGTGSTASCRLEVDVIAPAGTYDNDATITGSQTFADGTTDPTISIVVSDTLTYESVLDASKSFLPASVGSGGKSTVTIRLENSGAAALTNVQIIDDTMDTGLVLDNPVNPNTTCSGPVSFIAIPGSQSITMSGAKVFGGTDANPGSCDLLFNVVATGGSNWDNTIDAGNISADGNITNQSPITATLNNSGTDTIAVTKSIVGTTNLSFPGEIRTLNITINSDTLDVTNLSLTDYFTLDGKSSGDLNGWKIAEDPQATTNCPGGIVDAVANGVSVGISGVTLSADSCELTVNVTLGKFTTTVNNIIPDDAVRSDQGFASTGGSTPLSASGIDIGIVKSFSPGTIQPGKTSRLSITLINTNIDEAINTTLIDDLDGIGLKIADTPSLFTNCQGNGLNIDVSDNREVNISGVDLPALDGSTPGVCYLEVDVETKVANDTGVFTNVIAVDDLEATVGATTVNNDEQATAVLKVYEELEIHLAI